MRGGRTQADPHAQEFKTLQDDANIYKMVGPVLLKQDKTEANMAVDGRLDFIAKEMYVARQQRVFASRQTLMCYRERIEEKIKEIEQDSESKRMDIFQIQQQAQAAQSEAAA